MKSLINTIPYVILFLLLVFVFRLFYITSYKYSNYDGSFTFEALPNKGRNMEMMKRKYASYMEDMKPENGQVYRVFKKQYWKFWLWLDYVNRDYYNFPYKDWNEIEHIRGPIRLKSRFQDF